MVLRGLLLAVMGAVLTAAPLTGNDELTLHSGKIIVGDIITTDDADPIRIKVQEGSIKATLSYPADKVKSIARGVNQRGQQIETLRAALQALPQTPMISVSYWWATLQELRKLEADAEFRFALREFIGFFPNHREARKELGYELYEGKWMTKAEIQQAKGFIYYDKAWRTADEVSQLEAEKEQARQERIKHKEARKARRELLAEARRVARSQHANSYFPSYSLNPHPSSGHTTYVLLPVQRYSGSVTSGAYNNQCKRPPSMAVAVDLISSNSSPGNYTG